MFWTSTRGGQITVLLPYVIVIMSKLNRDLLSDVVVKLNNS